jgi:hypothetical protein
MEKAAIEKALQNPFAPKHETALFEGDHSRPHLGLLDGTSTCKLHLRGCPERETHLMDTKLTV